MKTKLFIIFFLLFTGLSAFAQKAINNNYKEVVLTPKRAEIVLNNTWLFQPAINQASDKPLNEHWDNIQVPSSWYSKFEVDSVLKAGSVANKEELKNLSRAWYQTTVIIPVNWKKNTTELQLTKVSTDAVIFVNGQNAGNIHWYTGLVDISKFVKYGQKNQIRILVIATPNEGEIPVLMGTATTQVTFTKATLDTRGITGDVILSSHPKKTFVSDIFVKPSVRQKKVDLDVEIIGIKKQGLVSVTADMVNEKGLIEKTFTSTVNVMAKDTQTVKLSFDWTNPRLWDLDKPELYTLKLKLNAKNIIEDVYPQEFGFREFWIDGKHFYLNGTKINLRPQFIGGSGMNELIDACIDGVRKNGFNISEIWPNNYDKRGFLEYSEQLMARSDKKGYLLMGVALPFIDYLLDKTWTFQWDKPEVRLAYEKRMLINLRRDRNHPSVVMWTTSANFFGDTQDQNPLNIGRVNWVKNNPPFQKNADAGIEAINIIKKNDPTRPVYTHHGTYVGDVHTLNFYLNLLPLQEREEWMSNYSKFGQIPFIGIEFGTPLFCSFLRGRNGFGSNIKSEPLITEFSAMYLGEKAYSREPSYYRKNMVSNFIKDQTYNDMTGDYYLKMWSFQQIEKLFTKNTFRSWRTYDMPGGMLPWDSGHGWIRNDTAGTIIKMKPFELGRKGMYYPTAHLSDIYYKQEPAYTTQPGGKAFIENNNATLAYIGGSTEAFTAKDHNFKLNQAVEKQLFYFNDTREIQNCTWNYKVTIAGKTISENKGECLVPVGDKKSETILFNTPKQINGFKTDGMIILNANIGNHNHTDTLNFRVFNKQIIAENSFIYTFDPVGKTNYMLKTLGYKVKNWKGDINIPFLVIGRDVLSEKFKLPASLENFVKNGGKAIVFNQQDSVLEKSGFRVSKYVSRYVFPIEDNVITKDLDELDLRNWAGVGTINTAYPDYMNSPYEKSPDDSPIYGWHWGNRGSVATNAIEKPHNSGWTPLMQCEFDMAYSPLMELNYGKGKLIWCSLDLEDHADQDPVAEILAKRLMEYMKNSKLQPRNLKTIFIGNSLEQKLLDNVGLDYVKSNQIESNAELIICGSVNSMQEKELTQYANNGGKVFILPKKAETIFMGVSFTMDSNFDGGKIIPDWDLSKGLSLSDVRYRSTTPSILLKKGCDISINGLLGRKNLGKGEVVFCQIDPNRFHADTLTYNRFTRWRANRAVVQVLANLGASFKCDENIFKEEKIEINSIDLDKTIWKSKMTLKLPAVKDLADKYKDPGMSNEAIQLVKTDADETGMIDVNVPNTPIDVIYNDLQANDGEAVFRKTINIPVNMVGKDLQLILGSIDDFDNTYFNGEQVGLTDNSTNDSWNFKRVYTVPGRMVKLGKNVIAIRVFDRFGGGGLLGVSPKREIRLKEQKDKKKVTLYNPDYRADFDLGDNPFRYFRW
jgi:beta-galactosidase